MLADNDQRLADDRGGEIVARFGDPGFPPDAEPFMAEHGLLFELEEAGVGVAARRQGFGVPEIGGGTVQPHKEVVAE